MPYVERRGKMRKYIKFILLLVIGLLLSCFNMYEVKADSKGLNVKYELGFDGNYKVESSAPIKLTVENNMQDIEGTVEIHVPIMPGKYTSYVKPISIPKGSTKEIIMNVPIMGSYSKYKIIINNGKNKVYENEATLSLGSNNMTMFIGILSEDFDSVSYINKIPAPNGMSLSNKVIRLNEKNLPEDVEVMNSFNLIVINNFDTAKLSDEQYEALKDWVNKGGTLLIGTGNTYLKTLGIFKDNFIEGDLGKIEKVKTGEISKLASKGVNNTSQDIDILNLEVKGANDILTSAQKSLVKELSRGKGKVLIFSFDLGVSPFTGGQDSSAFIENLLGSSMNIDNSINGIRNGRGDLSYLLREVMNLFSEMPSPSTGSFSLILIIYILIVAPLSYIILKKLDKREFMWVVVPAISLVFALIMYISGSSSRISTITNNTVSIVSIDEKGIASRESYFGIFTPNKMKIKVSGTEGEAVKPINNPYYGDDRLREGATGDLDAKIYDGANKYVEFNDASILSNKVVSTKQSIIKSQSMETDFSYENNSIKGSIKNLTEMDLEDCVILTPGQYVSIGDIKKGEVKEVNGALNTYDGNLYEFINKVYGFNGPPPTISSEEERKKFIDRQQKRMMLELLMRRGLREKVNNITLIGFTKSKVANPILVNDSSVKTYERTLVRVNLKVNFVKDNVANYPLGFVEGRLLAGSLKYDEYAGRIFGSGYGEVLYDIDKKINVEEVEFKIDSRSNNVKNYFWNKSTNVWEEAKEGKLGSEEIKKYIDNNNVLKVKVDLGNGGDSTLPKISVRGRVK